MTMVSQETDHTARGSVKHFTEPFTVKRAHGQAIRVVVFYDAKALHHAVGPARGGVGDHRGTLLGGSQGSKDLLLGHDQGITL
jgi:hypothetical protein